MTKSARTKVKYRGVTIRQRLNRGGAWQVQYPARDGKRTFKLCPTLEAARGAVDFYLAEQERLGVTAQEMSVAQRLDATTALALLKGSSTLEAAVRFYLKHHPLTAAMTLAGMRDKYLDHLAGMVARQELRPLTYKGSRKKLNLVCQDLGDTALPAVDATLLDQWLDDRDAGKQYAHNIKACVSAMFAWAMDSNLVDANPATRMKARTPDRHPPVILTPDEVAAFMRTVEAVAPEMSCYYALSFFGGLRPTEAAAACWEGLDWTVNELTVRAQKTHSTRIVHVCDNLLQWLTAKRQASGSIAPAPGTIPRWHKRAVKAAGVKWCPDVARHCFCTYHLALHKSLDAVTLEVGHTSTAILFRHYRGLAKNREAQARAYFNIMPAAIKAGNVIKIGVAS